MTLSSSKFHQALDMSTALCFLHVICNLLFVCINSFFLLFLYFTVLANVFGKYSLYKLCLLVKPSLQKIAHILYHHPTATDPFLMIYQAPLKVFNIINFVNSFCVLRISCCRGAKKTANIHKQVRLVDRKRKLLNFCIMAVNTVS